MKRRVAMIALVLAVIAWWSWGREKPTPHSPEESARDSAWVDSIYHQAIRERDSLEAYEHDRPYVPDDEFDRRQY
jgi:hypothetical protein